MNGVCRKLPTMLLITQPRRVEAWRNFQIGSKSRKIEFAICDVGASIPKTLRPSHPEIYEDFDALSWAIREGVTRDPAIEGRSNGLFGSPEVCAGSGGFISIQSGRGSLHKNQDGLSLKNQKSPLPVH